MSIGGRTRVAGVVGAPVTHSLSPLIHNAWIAAACLDAVYVPFPVEPGCFAAFLAGVRGGALLGVNVTAPFKVEALALADEASTEAAQCGSANLLRFGPGGGVWAHSTDGQGLLTALAEYAASLDLGAGATVILGAGGAARAVAAAVLRAGAPSVRLLARSAEAAARTAADLGPRAIGGPLAKREAPFGDAVLLVNATPAGVVNADLASFLADRLASGAVVIDLVYRPLATPLLRAAGARGLTTVDGLAMLTAQAMPSFAALFGRPPPDLDVRSLALEAMGEEDFS